MHIPQLQFHGPSFCDAETKEIMFKTSMKIEPCSEFDSELQVCSLCCSADAAEQEQDGICDEARFCRMKRAFWSDDLTIIC